MPMQRMQRSLPSSRPCYLQFLQLCLELSQNTIVAPQTSHKGTFGVEPTKCPPHGVSEHSMDASPESTESCDAAAPDVRP